MADPRPAVLELFTSEGCSSCPPAEHYIAELATGRSDVLPLTIHVDYWDDLGWRDRFASKSGTARQRAYASSLRKSQVYTPQAIIDGRLDFVGSDRRAIGAELAAQRSGAPIDIEVSGNELRVRLGAAEASGAKVVLLIGYLRRASTPIGRGENAGRTIEEFNIVRSISTLGDWNGATQTFEASRSSLPSDVTHVAVLAQAKGQGAIVAAATRALD